ncbi:MAG: methylmalonyl-CoA mutase family protein [Saprospiraceae bacterium]
MGKTIKENWNSIISKKLKEGTKIKDLAHRYQDDIVIEPNVMSIDIVNVKQILSQKECVSMAAITQGNDIQKNKSALLALSQGANGLSIAINQADDLDIIFKNILTEYIDVVLTVDNNNNEAQKWLKNCQLTNVRIVSNSEIITIVQDMPLSIIGHNIAAIDNKKHVVIEVYIGKNILFEIAKLRAIRIICDKGGYSITVVAKYLIDGHNELGDYNLIEKTYKVYSAIIGGADVIVTDYKGDEESRLALNIYNVLDLESGIKTVFDPTAGAYYIEKLTTEIINKIENY